MKDVLGQAISDYYNHASTGKLWVHTHWNQGPQQGLKEEMPVEVYFRDTEDMPELEWIALQHCRGKILDIGAGAGSHALALQKMGRDITALEISPLAAAVIRQRGVNKVIGKDFFELNEGAYDTLLLLMNGIGLAATIEGLRRFFGRARALLSPGGQLLFDSSDVAYLYNGKPPASTEYYGEVVYQYEYRRQRSDRFKWLFIDRETLMRIATGEGWQVEVLFDDGQDQFLVACTVRS